MSRIDIYIDVRNRRAISGPDSASAPTLSFTQGDTYDLVLHGQEADPAAEAFQQFRAASIPWATLAAGVTLLDAPPRDGTFRVRVKETEQSTPDLRWNATRAEFVAAVNALPAVAAAGGVKILTDGPAHFYNLQWNEPANAVELEIPSATNKLVPLCVPVIRADETTAGKVNIKVVRAPVAYTDQFALPAAPAVTRTRLRSGSALRNEVQRITVPSAAVGQFSVNGGRLLPVATVTAAALADALNAPFTAVAPADVRYVVTASGRGLFDVEFVGVFAATAMEMLAVEMFDQVSIDEPTGRISFRALAIDDMLAGAASVPAIFEVVAMDEAGRETTLVQQSCTILNDGLSAAVGQYIQEVAVRTETVYVNPDPDVDPVVIANLGQRYPTPAAGTTFVYTHNFGTHRVEVVCMQKMDDAPETWRQMPDDEFLAEVINANQVRLTFQEEILGSPLVGSIDVWIRTLNAVPIVNDHRHSTDAVDGVGGRSGKTLTEIVEELYNNLPEDWPNIPAAKISGLIQWSQIGGNVPDARIPANIPRANEQGFLPIGAIPLSVPRVDAETGELVYWGVNVSSGTVERRVILDAAGTLAAERVPRRDAPSGIRLDPPDVEVIYPPERSPGVYRALARAVKPSSLTDISTLLTAGVLPAASAHAGEVLQWDGSVQAAVAPSTKTRVERKWTRETAPFLSSDGANWHAAEAYDGTYYPLAFNREIFDVPVAEGMLADGSYFEISWTLLAQILGPRRGQYYVTLKAGAPVATGSGMGGNIASVNFATPIFERRIVLAGARTEFPFGYRVSRAANGTLSAEARTYLTWASATAPAGPEFVLRCEMNRFDAEDASAPLGFSAFTGNNAVPVGQVRVACTGIRAGIALL